MEVEKIILDRLEKVESKMDSYQSENRKEFKEIRFEMGSLKIKVASFGAIFGVLGAYLKSKFLS